MGLGFKQILKIYGKIKITDANGNIVVHVWDYANDEARIKSEMTEDELASSKKAKLIQLRK